MQRSITMNFLQRQVLAHKKRNKMIHEKMIIRPAEPPCDVFINHRGIDTKRTVASLLYDHLRRLNLRPFLDNKNMKPGDKLFEKIDNAVNGCKIGVAVFSPNYCKSHFCLHELALMVESKKKMIPIFCDINPSQLHVMDDGRMPRDEIERFNMALEEAKYTVGLAFDSQRGNWSDVVKDAADIVVESLVEFDHYQKINEEGMMRHIYSYY